MRLLPSDSGSSNNDPEEDFIVYDSTDEPESPLLNEKYSYQSKVREPKLSIQLLIDENAIKLDQLSFPDLSFELEKLSVAKFIDDVFRNIDLTLTYRNIIGLWDSKVFDTSISHNSEEKEEFIKMIMEKKGFMSNDNNYIFIDPSQLSASRTGVSSRNARVVLIWSGVRLDRDKQRRIISLGFLYLSKYITKADLLFQINNILPFGDFVVNLKYEASKYVVIAIETPLFSA